MKQANKTNEKGNGSARVEIPIRKTLESLIWNWNGNGADRPAADFYVIRRTVPGEPASYLSDSPYGRWMLGPVYMVEGLIVLLDLAHVKRFLQDIEGAAVAIRNPGYETESEIGRRDAAGKVTMK